MNEIRIAMAGLAHSHGTGFLRSALTRKGVSVVGFFDNDNPENAKAASAEFGAPVFTDLDELLYRSGANTMLTACINCDKPRYIIRGLEAGLGVIADKPMATRLEDLEKMEAAAARTGAPIYLMLTERFDSAVYTAKQLIDRGDVGTVVQQYLVRPHRLRPSGRPDWMFHRSRYGGIFNDIGVHDVDLARFFAGCEISRVLAASTGNARFPQFTDFCDHAMALFEMENGGTAAVAVNWLTPDAYHAHGDVRFCVTGTKGALEISTVEQTVRICTDSEPEHFAEIIPCPLNCAEDALNAMADRAYRPMITTADSIAATKAALLAQQAAEAGR